MSPSPISPLSPPALQSAQKKLRWGRLYGSAAGLALTHAAQQADGPTLVICRDSTTDAQLRESIAFYAAGTDLPVLHFPDQETLPYDKFSPHPDIISRRLEVMARLPTMGRGIVVVPAHTLMQRIAPPAYIHGHTFLLAAGEDLDREALLMRLERGGYHNVAQVMEHGEYALRGSIIDLFPMGAEQPYRIDLFDEEIETIRLFDPETQRTTEKVSEIRLFPAREFPMTEEAVKQFRQRYRAKFEGDPQQNPVYRDVSQGIAPAGIEYYLPLFFDNTNADNPNKTGTATLFDYLPDNAQLMLMEGIEASAEIFRQEVEERYETQQSLDALRRILEPDELFLRVDELFGQFKHFPRAELDTFEQDKNLAQQNLENGTNQAGQSNFATQKVPQLSMPPRSENPLQRVAKFLDEFEGRMLIVAESAGRREALLELFRGRKIHPKQAENWNTFIAGKKKLAITVAPLEAGLMMTEPEIVVLTEPQIFGEQVLQRRRRSGKRRGAISEDAVIHHLSELKIGDPVVHVDHGVGRYQGLQSIEAGGNTAEYLLLEYAKEDKLYVPVTALHLIGRYTGVEPDKAPVHRLGSDQWTKAKRKAAEKVRDVAAELLEIYAKRAAKTGHAITEPDLEYHQFSAQFPFEETPDQSDAIGAIIKDMESPQPMDRLICGDVGFGKTEVAMRAVFLAVQNGHQVAVLVPTTLLAQQHYENFTDRFADWPFKVEVLSRFKTKKETDDALKLLADGKIDIVIGTHKLIQPTIKFHHLGMVVIDEEHRFGVRQKDQFKALRAEVDVLTMTATPIPRTLNMSMSGLRDLSIIATPPTNRVAIKTFVREWDAGLIREACIREIHRGGQVYFLHNQVETIERMADDVRKLIPEATVEIAHGQMREQELERVMKDFYHRRFNILVCSTIIETGIDVPTANTIIMNRADRLGLAQLYQLRGRVGRSHHRAYAYLVIPSRKNITADAMKRLEAIESIEELGAGFTLAVHDMEIRGAGELLGDGQSGHMQEIGFELYSEMLDQAVKDLKSGKTPEPSLETQVTEVDLGMPALLPEDYLPDINARLVLYKRIAAANNADELHELQVEMIDRFGLLPDPTKNLILATEIRLQAAPLGIRKVEFDADGLQIAFNEKPEIDPLKLIELIQKQHKVFQLKGQDKLRMNKPAETVEERVEAWEKLLEQLV